MLQIVILNPNGKGMIHPRGHAKGLQVHNHAHLFTSLSDVLHSLGDNRENVFCTMAHHQGIGGDTPSRTKASFDHQTAIYFDLDRCDTARAFEYRECVAQVLGTEANNLTLVNSGNGLQIFANLKTPYRSTKYMAELKPAYNEVCRKIQAEVKSRELPIDKVDPVVFDPARVFRVPGTVNRKPGIPDRESVLLHYSPATLELDLMAISGLDRIAKENIDPARVRQQYPKPDFQEMVKECRFVRGCLDAPATVHEPQFFDLVSLLAPQSPAAKVLFQDQDMAPIDLAKYVFDNAVNSQSLQRQDFVEKWESAIRYGARKCSTIGINTPEACQGCPHRDKIPTPLALKSKDHIASADMGYWVMNSKGNYSHPNYVDLTKVLNSARAIIATKEERLMGFEKTQYDEVFPLHLKSWVEGTVAPPDPLREAHCNEFVKKVLRVGGLSSFKEEYLFNQSILGKLNCQNGIVDIVKGELLPHSAEFGFRYTLPYDYIEGEGSELFLDWLSEITQSRDELMESILDIMAYILWPNYDDHLFAFFVGEGANGKSTLIRIIQTMVGDKNYSTVNIQQLGGNRFAPAQLEGKLVNLSEESSGYRMGLEEMNVIKNLSSGGEMLAERKGEQGFTFRNKAKLIFSGNKPPTFDETGIAIQRRMLAIPFDHQIANPDDRIARQLILEVPKIVSMLIRRIQENVKLNGGRFVVARGGSVARETQRKLLTAGDSSFEFGREHLESSHEYEEETYVSTADAYARYRQWCGENGYEHPHNASRFSSTMFKFIVTPAVDKSKNLKKVNGKPVRVFPKTRWKEDALL